MLNMVILLCILVLIISIFIGFVLLKTNALMTYYKNKEEDVTSLHSKINALENDLTEQAKNHSLDNQNNSIQNKKHDIPIPKIILDNKIYSQQDFFKDIKDIDFQMSPMLQSKFTEKK